MLVTIALANKMARIVWALMAHGGIHPLLKLGRSVGGDAGECPNAGALLPAMNDPERTKS
ncbi:hypothetical protein ASD47_11305 [Caulobacter sp. Root1472]|nr:hypothetical protein [Caulobacter sp. Root1472]KQZ18026.1 hypothetical protein ASD47_11305 [Caulobacter sp. Root1472]